MGRHGPNSKVTFSGLIRAGTSGPQREGMTALVNRLELHEDVVFEVVCYRTEFIRLLTT